jgi:hypothetical protein
LRILYSIVVPIYGERYRLELSFVNDGSSDDSLDAPVKSAASYHGE